MSNWKQIIVIKPLPTDRRLQIILCFLFAVFSVLIFRLWTLQVYQQEEFKEKAQRNIRCFVEFCSRRGLIKDSNGIVLATDQNYWDVWMPIARNREVTPEVQQSLMLLSEILKVPYDRPEYHYKTASG